MARRKSETWGKQDMKWFIIFMIILVWTVSRAVLIDMVMAEGPIEPRLTAEEIRILINLHNKVRQTLGLALWFGRKAWQDMHSHGLITLPPQVADWSTVHTGKRKQEYGENLFMGTEGYYGVADAVRAWEREKSVYHGEPLAPPTGTPPVITRN